MNKPFENSEQNVIDELILQFDEEWHAHRSSPKIEEYLRKIHSDQRKELLCELVLIDMENRWRLGDFRNIQSYEKAFGEILEKNPFFPKSVILKQFELEWARFISRPHQWPTPKIHDFLSKKYGTTDLKSFFWDLVTIEFQTEYIQHTQPRLENYKKLYTRFFTSEPHIPTHLIEKQFHLDWKSFRQPTITTYVANASKGEQQKLCVRLIEEDMVNRWDSGNPKWIENYIDEFPELIGNDGEIPQELGLRERTLGFAAELNNKKIRCPYCHAIQNKGPHLTECESCARLLQQKEKSTTFPQYIEQYQIIRILGIGGFGIVFKAWDKKNQRMVALKRPNSPTLSTRRINRFKREAEIVSKLNHPNIVRIHDYKIEANTDHSYIAYHYVNGSILTSLIKVAEKNFEENLVLMIQICKAVSFAHQRKIIHRDLKPRNILLEENGNPLVSDFGLARISTFIQAPKQTHDGQIVGTPEYMSPEQFQGKRLDYRSDIYSLGVIIYELITGQTPFSYASVIDLKKKVCEETPSQPSTLNAALPPGIDAICLRALEKSPSRRYASVKEIAKDLQRLLDGQLIRAHPPSLVRRSLVWCWWNPRKLILGIGNGIAVFLLIMATLVLLTSKKPEKTEYRSLWQRRIQQLDKHYAKIEQHDIKRLPYYLVHQDDEVYQQTFTYLRDKAGYGKSDLDLILNAYKKGEFEPVLTQLKLTADFDDLDTLYHSGNIRSLQKNFSASLEYYEKALKRSLLHPPNDMHHEILQRIGDTHMALGDCNKAQNFLTEALKVATTLYGKKHQETADNWIALGDSWYCLGVYKKSEACFKKAHQIDLELFASDHPDVARDVDRLAGVWHDLGYLEKAKKGFEEALFLFIEEYEFEHITVARACWHIGNTYYSLGDYQKAYTKFKNALIFYQMYYGQRHPQVSSALNHVGGALHGLNRNKEALPFVEKALQIDQELAKSDPSNRASVARDWGHVGGIHYGLGNYEKAIECFTMGLDIIRKIDPIDSTIVARCLGGLGSSWMELGELHKAQGYYEETQALHIEQFGDQHHFVARDLMNLSILFEKMGKGKKAVRFCRQAYQLYKKTLGENHPSTKAARYLLKNLENKKGKN